jgi:hypothetical protein
MLASVRSRYQTIAGSQSNLTRIVDFFYFFVIQIATAGECKLPSQSHVNLGMYIKEVCIGKEPTEFGVCGKGIIQLGGT